MDKKRDCKIVQDLLPNYLENLTSNETNEYIKEHLLECKDCKKTEEIMKKGINTPKEKELKKVNYLKKYKRKMFIFKSVISVMVLLILVFAGNVFYKWQLLSKIYNHNVDFYLGDNYVISYRDGNSSQVTKQIYKNGTYIIKPKENSYIWGNDTKKYIINEEEKIYVEIDPNAPPMKIDSTTSIGTYTLFNFDSKKDLLKLILTEGLTIREEEYGDYDCYVILVNGEKVWVDKDSLLIIRDDYNGQVKEIKVEINTVTDEYIALPNLEDYTKVQNN